MGVGDGSNRVGVVVGAEMEVEAGLVVAREGCVAVNAGEGSTVGKLCGAQAVHRTKMERKKRDFIFALMRSMFK